MTEQSGVSATALFVEVLVIGSGALLSAILLIAGIQGPSMLSGAKAIPSPALAFFGIAFAYALGIAVDRLADRFFKPWSARLRAKHFDDDETYYRARALVSSSSALAATYGYARSRLRVVRGWCLNIACIQVFTMVLLHRLPGGLHARADLVTLTSLLGLGCLGLFVYSWHTLSDTTYRQLAHTQIR